MTTRLDYANELRGAVRQFRDEYLSTASIGRLIEAVVVIADRMDGDAGAALAIAESEHFNQPLRGCRCPKCRAERAVRV